MKMGQWLDRNKWFIVVCGFLVINLFGVLQLDVPQHIGGSKLYAEFKPGTGAEVSARNRLTWMYSEPMVSEKDIGEQTEHAPAAISPHIEGVWRWADTDLLEFIPNRPWPGATAFLVRFPDGLKSQAGNRLMSSQTYEFHSEPVRMISVCQTDWIADSEALLQLAFNQKVSPAVLRKFLRILTPKGVELEYKINGEVSADQIMVSVACHSNRKLKISIRKGFFGEVGPLPAASDLEQAISIEDGVSLTGLSVTSPSYENPSVVLFFSRPVDLDSLRRSVKIEPAVRFSVEQRNNWNWNRASQYVVAGDFIPGRNYTLSLEKGLKSRDGAARLEQECVRQLYIPDRRPDVRIRFDGNYLSPSGNLNVPLTSVNVTEYEVEITRVFPNNLVQYAMRAGGHYDCYYGQPAESIGEYVTNRKFSVSMGRNEVAKHSLNLRELLPEDPHGAFVVQLSRAGQTVGHRLIVVTDTGITVKESAGSLLVWANSIHTLAAVSNAKVQVWSEANQLLCESVTDEEGLALLPLPSGADPFLVSVVKDHDLSFLNIIDTRLPSFSASGKRPYISEGYEAFVYSDRGVYRPGETAHVRAVVRGGNRSCPQDFPVELHVLRPDGRLHSKKQSVLSPVGTAVFEVPWADHDATGGYRLQLTTPGSTSVIGSTTIAVEDFVPPRIAVDAFTDKTKLLPGEQATLQIKARYLYGPPASGNFVSARVEFSPAPFRPDGWKDYVFGDSEKSFPLITRALGSGHLDEEGEGHFTIQTGSGMRPPAALSALLSASVMEQGGRTVSAFARCTIYPYPFYIGLRSTGLNRLRPGETSEVELALVKPDGSNLSEARKLNLSLERVTWSTVLEKDRNGSYHYKSVRKLVRAIEDSVETGADGKSMCTITPGGSGDYLLCLTDPENGVSSSLKFYVGGDLDRWQTRSMEQPGRLELKLNSERYTPGETAILSVTAPFSGKALLTVEQNRVIHREVLQMTGNTVEFAIPVTTGFWPNAHASVSVIREVAPSDAQDIYRAVGSIPILLQDQSIRLNVDMTTPKHIRPLSKLEIELAVRDSQGKGRQAEVAIAAVDEGICMLTGFQTPDPVGFFTALRQDGVNMSDLYSLLMPETDDELLAQQSHVGGDLARLLKGRLNPVKSRRFKPVVLWRSGILTDSNGAAHITLDIPEFRGSLRLMAVAVSSNRFGSAAEEVTVTRPFTVLSSLPRFLAPGDRCVMPVELHNATGRDGEAILEIACEGPIHTSQTAPIRLPMKNGERISVEIPVEADAGTGVALIRLKASLGTEHVEEVTEIPIRPATAMQSVFGTVAIPAGEQQCIALPGGWMNGTEQHELQLSALPAVTLKGGLEYLLQYPYGCLEQTVSASFPLLNLADLVNRPDSPIQVGNVSNRVASGISRVLSMQLANGGFAWWPQQNKVYEWGSMYATHFLIEAQKAGYAVPQSQLDAALDYLRGRLSSTSGSSVDLQSKKWREDAGLRAYACHVLALAGNPEHGWMARLREQAAFLDYDSRLHLVMALAASGMRRDAWNELQAIGSVPTGMNRRIDGSLSSSARSAALLLYTMMEFDPDHAGIPALVAQVESHMEDGCWYTTQENALSLMALGKYMRHTANEVRTCSGWLERNGERKYFGPNNLPLRMDFTSDEATIMNDGPGTLYCGWMARGIPVVPANVSADYGISVRRTFLNSEQQPVDATVVKQGELLVVKLTINTQGRILDNVVIEDLLPAGLEIENGHLKTSQLIPWATTESTLPVRHLEIRDDRLVLFANAFIGEKEFFYAVRAVSPGDYTLPAVSASVMYAPAVKSSHGAGQIRVVE